MIGNPQRTRIQRLRKILNPKSVWSETAFAVQESGELKPTLSTLNISADKFFVGFSEIHDAFHDSNYLHHDGQHPAGQDRHQKHDDAFSLVAENELVNAKGAHQYAAYSGRDLLVGAS